jgi:hypothetical protein
MKIDTSARIAEGMPYQFDIRELWNRVASLTQVNILEQGEKYLAPLAAPGMKGNDFKIDRSGNMLNILGETEVAKEKTYSHQENNYKNFNHSFTLFGFINMKKVFTLIALVTTLSTASFAQETANLNIILSDVLSFTVNQASLDVNDINFNTEERYTKGITALASDHVSVTSSRGYVVEAVAGEVTGKSSISAGTVKITSTVGASNKGNVKGITYGSEVTLPEKGGTAATVISADYTSWSESNSTNSFNISYLIGSGGAYAGKPTGSNIVPVVYTVTQK